LRHTLGVARFALLLGLSLIGSGPGGGTLSQVVIPNPFAPAAVRPTVVYLPPHASMRRRYPVLFMLQGFPGSPYSFSSGLRLANVADREIGSGVVRPFVAVIPPAGPRAYWSGEWAGPWERFLLRRVIPWADAHLPVMRDRRDRAIAGLSAGGYGAVDIALRHPRLFGTVESWSGYFSAPRDGVLALAPRRVLQAHDPLLLLHRKAPLLRRLDTRFFIASGSTHDRRGLQAALAFSRELTALGVSHELALRPGGHDGRLWRAQLPAALRYALEPF
jgi:enterochelin esterase-like enzyme